MRHDPLLSVQVIRAPLEHVDPDVRRIHLVADRLTLAKRRWRGKAEDGEEFGFDLTAPMKNGVAFCAMKDAVYVIAQRAEPVLEVVLIPRSAPVARLGWAIGNLHFPIEVTDDAILTRSVSLVGKLNRKDGSLKFRGSKGVKASVKLVKG